MPLLKQTQIIFVIAIDPQEDASIYLPINAYRTIDRSIDR